MVGVVGWLMRITDVKFESRVYIQEQEEAAGRQVKEGESVQDGLGKFVTDVVNKHKVVQKDLIVIVYRYRVSESQIERDQGQGSRAYQEGGSGSASNLHCCLEGDSRKIFRCHERRRQRRRIRKRRTWKFGLG